nr:hypothetical protein [Tanacetum cinerariifolium]
GSGDLEGSTGTDFKVTRFMAFFHLILEMNHIRMKDFDKFKCRAFQVLRFEFSDSLSFTESIQKHCHITSTSDDGIDQAGSGVADECACASGAISSFICRSSGVEETDNLSLVSVIVQALYSAKATVFEDLGAIEPRD